MDIVKDKSEKIWKKREKILSKNKHKACEILKFPDMDDCEEIDKIWSNSAKTEVVQVADYLWWHVIKYAH